MEDDYEYEGSSTSNKSFYDEDQDFVNDYLYTLAVAESVKEQIKDNPNEHPELHSDLNVFRHEWKNELETKRLEKKSYHLIADAIPYEIFRIILYYTINRCAECKGRKQLCFHLDAHDYAQIIILRSLYKIWRDHVDRFLKEEPIVLIYISSFRELKCKKYYGGYSEKYHVTGSKMRVARLACTCNKQNRSWNVKIVTDTNCLCSVIQWKILLRDWKGSKDIADGGFSFDKMLLTWGDCEKVFDYFMEYGTVDVNAYTYYHKPWLDDR
jgi:hypothetical protein